MAVFGVTSADLLAKLQPREHASSFSIGNDEGDDLSTAGADSIIAVAEDRVLCSLPERYRQLFRGIDGEVVIRSAQEGQTTFTCGAKPVVAGSLRIYVNFPRAVAWSERSPEPRTDGSDARGSAFPLPADQYALTPSTGAVTLTTALDEGDVVWAAYSHTLGASMPWFRDLVTTYAAIEVARRFNYFKSAEGFDRFERWNLDADLWLKNFAKGEAPGADLIDGLTLVRETRGKKLSQVLKIGRF